MPKRDPRVDPRQGDVLTSGKWIRRVIAIGKLVGRPESVTYERRHLTTGSIEVRDVRDCYTAEGWQRWSRTAKVVRIAPE